MVYLGLQDDEEYGYDGYADSGYGGQGYDDGYGGAPAPDPGYAEPHPDARRGQLLRSVRAAAVRGPPRW